VGFATSVPASVVPVFLVPVSNTAYLSPKFIPETSPGPPTNPQAIFEIIFPYCNPKINQLYSYEFIYKIRHQENTSIELLRLTHKL
jgi:hypothetical protein